MTSASLLASAVFESGNFSCFCSNYALYMGGVVDAGSGPGLGAGGVAVAALGPALAEDAQAKAMALAVGVLAAPVAMDSEDLVR